MIDASVKHLCGRRDARGGLHGGSRTDHGQVVIDDGSQVEPLPICRPTIPRQCQLTNLGAKLV
jgi:hypothetical protein